MIQIGLIVLLMFVIQTVLSAFQMKHFSNEFVKLRKKGKVACGRKSGGFNAGAIVMFLIDDHGIIKEGKKLMGVTVLARVTPLPGFEGKYIGGLTEDDLPKHGKNLRKAILDARNTYLKFTAGEPIPEPPSPFQRVRGAFTGKAKT